MQFRKYTEEQMINAIKNSSSYAQALKLLNVAPHGGNYRTIKNYVEKLRLDVSHFTGQGWAKGQIIGEKRPIEDYLSNKNFIQSHSLKLKLFNSNLKNRQCEICLSTNWQNQPIPLELHHIDGNHKNNNLTNLQILCPNCHAITDNYRGKNKSNA